MSKSKLYAVIATLALVGCTTHKPPPLDVQLIPNDCANIRLIVAYLTEEASRPKSTFESERDYERHRAQLRQRIWTMRYHCQPV